MTQAEMTFRRGCAADAADIATILGDVVAERVYTALDRQVSEASERQWIEGLGARSILVVAEAERRVVGFQSLEPCEPVLGSMDHVGIAATQLAPEVRGRGVGRALWRLTKALARDHGYEKAVVQVRAGNTRALGFYRSLGFSDFGVARRHVLIDGVYEDAVFLEAFLEDAARP